MPVPVTLSPPPSKSMTCAEMVRSLPLSATVPLKVALPTKISALAEASVNAASNAAAMPALMKSSTSVTVPAPAGARNSTSVLKALPSVGLNDSTWIACSPVVAVPIWMSATELSIALIVAPVIVRAPAWGVVTSPTSIASVTSAGVN